MKQLLLTMLVFCLGGSVLSAADTNHYYVNTEAEGEGTSWKDALGNLQAALDVAEAGDIIWVAAGVYTPETAEADRNISFIIPDGVQLFGGFEGTEKKLEDRVLGEHPTILSGNIGDEAIAEDNLYTVVTFNHVTDATILNGFVITGGFADSMDEGVSATTCGAAIFNNGELGLSSPTISNCTLIDNFAREGAAIYNFANEGETSPVFSDCAFIDNRSDFNGGAVFNDGNFGMCNPTFTNCRFSGNESAYGAGLLNRGSYGTCQPTVTNCIFTDNFSLVRGGAIYNQREGRGVCETKIENCDFQDNGATIGDGDVDESFEYQNATPAAPKRSGIRRRTVSDVAY